MASSPHPSEKTETPLVRRVWRGLVAHMWARVLLGLVLGVVMGMALGPDLNMLSREAALSIGRWVALPGHFFIAVIQMVVIPLVVASVVCGIAAGDNVRTIRHLGLRVVGYFLMTTSIAVAIGGGLALLLAPGAHLAPEAIALAQGASAPEVNSALLSTDIPARLVGLIPRNPFHAVATGEMLQIVLFAAVLGAALLAMPAARGKALLDVMQSTQEACMVVVGWILYLAPFAVFGLMVQLASKMGVNALVGMAFYMFTVLAGLLSLVVVYTIILKGLTGRSIGAFLKDVKDAQLIAFSTSSSSATMPVTLHTAEEKLHVPSSVSRFVVPLGATINMDGTALYQTVATVFLAQVFGIDIGVWEMLIVLVTAIAASVGTPGTPGVGLVVLASILSTIGVPAEGIAIILGVDRILDMCRTTVNVTGDLVATTVMAAWLKRSKL